MTPFVATAYLRDKRQNVVFGHFCFHVKFSHYNFSFSSLFHKQRVNLRDDIINLMAFPVFPMKSKCILFSRKDLKKVTN